MNDKPLVRIEPGKNTPDVTAFILRKHFEKWEKENRTKISNLIDKHL